MKQTRKFSMVVICHLISVSFAIATAGFLLSNTAAEPPKGSQNVLFVVREARANSDDCISHHTSQKLSLYPYRVCPSWVLSIL